MRLAVELRDADGDRVSGVAVGYVSADPSVVTVSSAGMIRSVGPAGATAVVVSAGGLSVEVPVTVGAVAGTLRVEPEEAIIGQLGTLQLVATLEDLDGTPIEGATYRYFSADPTVAEVSSEGLVTSVGPAGIAAIQVVAGGIAELVLVSVTAVPTTLVIHPDPVVMSLNSSRQLEGAVRDAVGDPITTDPVTYRVTGAQIVTVTTGGLVQAGSIPGSSIVTATAGGLELHISVFVSEGTVFEGLLDGRASLTGAAWGVALGPDDQLAVIELGGSVSRGTWGDDALASSVLTVSTATGVALTPDGARILVTGGQGQGVVAANAMTGVKEAQWPVSEQLFDVAVSPDGALVFAAGEQGMLHVLNADHLSLVASHQLPSSTIVHLLHHPTEDFVYASGGSRVTEFHVPTGTVRSFALSGRVQASALSADGSELYVAIEDRRIAILALDTGMIREVPMPECALYDLVSLSFGSVLLGSCPSDGRAVVIDPDNMQVTRVLQTGGGPRRIATSWDGGRAAIANPVGWVDYVR